MAIWNDLEILAKHAKARAATPSPPANYTTMADVAAMADAERRQFWRRLYDGMSVGAHMRALNREHQEDHADARENDDWSTT